MEKRNWKHSVTLKQRMVLCLAAFFAAFALQLALNGYQARAVQQVQDDQMGNFNAISRFQGGVESSISILEAYRWENGETEEMLEKLQAACSTSNAWLWRIRSNMDGLQNVSDEQWVLYGAVETTYGSYNTLLEELEGYLSSGQEAKASQLYYNKVSVCGGYLSQYTMQLLKASILDAQTTYTEISDLIERITALKPDIIAITGDMNDKLVDDYSVVTDLCKELVKIAPVYYVPGNHEWPKIVFHNSPIGTDLEAIGVHFLADETETLEVNGNTIAIGGVAEAPASYERYASAYFESFEQLDAFKLLLVHYPEYFLEDGFFSDVPVDLALCGHTHGGMIRIPGIGGLYTPDQGVLPTLTEGLHQIGDTSLIISRGLGDGKGTPVPRINNPPELVIVDINWF